MAQPTPFEPTTDFSTWQQQNPLQPFPAQLLDDEFDAVQLTTDQLIANLALLQRDDGQLHNEIITFDKLRQGSVFNGARVLAVRPGVGPDAGFLVSRGTVSSARFAAADYLEPPSTGVCLRGAGEPASIIGENGDHYRDTSSLAVYFKRADEWSFVANLPAEIPLTYTVRLGLAAPLSGLGGNGDLYVAEETGARYVKVAGAWVQFGRVGAAIDIPDPLNGAVLGWIDGRLTNVLPGLAGQITDLATLVDQQGLQIAARATLTQLATVQSTLEGAISSLENNLETAFQAADAALQLDINTRATLAQLLSVESDLEGSIATLETDLRTEYEAADDTLQGQIDTANAAIATKASLTQLATTQSTLEGSIASLEDELRAEYQAGDTTLQTNLNTEASTRASADTALGVRASALEASVNTPTTGLLARMTSAETVNTSQGTAITAAQSELTAARQGNVDLAANLTGMKSATTSVTNTASNLSTRMTAVDGGSASSVTLAQVNARTAFAPNLLPNPTGANGTLTGWTNAGVSVANYNEVPGRGRSFVLSYPASPGVANGQFYTDEIPMEAGVAMAVQGFIDHFNVASGALQVTVAAYNSSGGFISNFIFDQFTTQRFGFWSATGTTPAGTAKIRMQFNWVNVVGAGAGGSIVFRRLKLERGSAYTPYNEDASAQIIQQALTSPNSSTSIIGLETNASGVVTGIRVLSQNGPAIISLVEITASLFRVRGAAIFDGEVTAAKIVDNSISDLQTQTPSNVSFTSTGVEFTLATVTVVTGANDKVKVDFSCDAVATLNAPSSGATSANMNVRLYRGATQIRYSEGAYEYQQSSAVGAQLFDQVIMRHAEVPGAGTHVYTVKGVLTFTGSSAGFVAFPQAKNIFMDAIVIRK
jgi:hypothetical protein